MTPAYRAAQEGHVKVLVLLLDAGADPNTPNEVKVLPIIAAPNYNLIY